MTIVEVLEFMGMAGLAAYVQTVTGFAFGLILMGSVGLTSVMPLRDAAVVTGVLTLVNAGIMMIKGWRDVLRVEFLLVICSSLPALVLGYLLLDQLASHGLAYLRILLGAVIVVSAVQLLIPPKRQRQEATRCSFLFYGVLSGVMGGLFSTSGPPLVFHFYRQPLSLPAIRETLVAIFSLNALIRLVIVIGDGTFPERRYWPSLLAIITVSVGTQLARSLPLPLSPKAMKLTIFLLLCASGASLALPVVAETLMGH